MAIEYQADLLLVDESHARGIAEIYGLRKIGVIGLLIRAKCERRIDSLKVELDKLRERAGFWIEERLYYYALSIVGEG